MTNDKLRYGVSRKSIFVRLTSALLILSSVFRLVGSWGFWNGKTQSYIWLQIALPVLCCLLYIGITVLFGEKAFSLTAVPVILGAVFFVALALGYEGWLHKVIGVLLGVIVALGYTGTVFGVISTKWLLLPAFGLPFLCRILINDMDTILANENAMPLNDWLSELSVLCILLGLFFIVFAMKNKETPESETVEGLPSELSSDEIIDILELDAGKNAAAGDHKETDNE